MTDVVQGAASRDARSVLVEVAAALLRERGPAAVTTRAVAQAAGVQAPTIYRLFGDKDGLLDAVAEHVFAVHVTGKGLALESGDPVADLRSGWDVHVAFGLANPGLYGLINAPGRAERSPATADGMAVLRARVHRVAAAGRLRVAEPRAVELVHAAGMGTVLALVSAPPGSRDDGLADAMWDTLAAALFTDTSAGAADDVVRKAVTFRTAVPDLPRLSDAERALLTEWLDRAIRG